MLPQELLDEIVELLSGDRPSLMALSCTGHCLCARSQALLFHNLILSPTKPPSSYTPLLEMSPHILNYVHRLQVRIADNGASSPGPSHRRPDYEDASFGRLYHAVTNMDDLDLTYLSGWMSGNDFLPISEDVLLPILSSPRVRTLRLSKVFLPDPQSLFHALSYFPSVSSLRLHDVHTSGITSPSPDAGNILLTEISISTGMLSTGLGVSLYNNASSGWSRHLRSLIMESYSVMDLRMIKGLIPRLPNLVTLTFTRPTGDISHENTQRLATKIHVFPLQKIRSLRLSVPGVTSPLTRWWLGHLTQATAVSLECLAIDFLYVDVGAASEMQPSTVAWKEVESPLLHLPKLKSLSMKTVIDGNIRTICSSES